MAQLRGKEQGYDVPQVECDIISVTLHLHDKLEENGNVRRRTDSHQEQLMSGGGLGRFRAAKLHQESPVGQLDREGRDRYQQESLHPAQGHPSSRLQQQRQQEEGARALARLQAYVAAQEWHWRQQLVLHDRLHQSLRRIHGRERQYTRVGRQGLHHQAEAHPEPGPRCACHRRAQGETHQGRRRASALQGVCSVSMWRFQGIVLPKLWLQFVSKGSHR